MNWTKISLAILFVAIAYLSLKAPDGSIQFQVNDKIGHTLAYFCLALNLGVVLKRNRWFVGTLIAFAYSACLEYLQGFVPGRSVDGFDLIANATGALVGGLVAYLLYPQLHQLLKKMRLIA